MPIENAYSVVELLRRQSRDMELMANAAAAIEQIGVLDDSIAAAKANLSAVTEQGRLAKAEYVEIQESIKRGRADVAQAIKDTEQVRLQAAEKALAEGEAIIAKAKSDAIKQAEDIKNAEKTSLARIKGDITKASKQLDAVNEQLAAAEEKKKEVATLEARLETVKQAIANLGGMIS